MHPTPFQKQLFWTALTALSIVVLGAVVTLVGWLIVNAISFLQPVLIPVAVAAILAFLLDPVVRWLMRLRVSRFWSILIVYLAFAGFFVGILVWILPSVFRQGNELLKDFPVYSEKAQKLVLSTMDKLHQMTDGPFFGGGEDSTEPGGQFAVFAKESITEGVNWLKNKVPDFAVESWNFFHKSVGGVFGAFGFLLSFVLVPIFLFFFLMEGPSIAENWSNYLPLRASPLKSEIVEVVSEINSYLVSFFRGQLIVSLIDGLMIAVALLVMGLEFGFLIGLMVGVLGLIPYLGIMICWIPAVIIAAAQYGDWSHPLIVTVIFAVANWVDGMFVAPKIVGDSVGLHPLTVILSVLAWSLILGGLLGALLAVPLTAALKVLLKRYFWDRPATTGQTL